MMKDARLKSLEKEIQTLEMRLSSLEESLRATQRRIDDLPESPSGQGLPSAGSRPISPQVARTDGAFVPTVAVEVSNPELSVQKWLTIDTYDTRTRHGWVRLPHWPLIQSADRTFVLRANVSASIKTSSGPNDDESIFTIVIRYFDANGNQIPVKEGVEDYKVKCFVGAEKRGIAYKLPINKSASFMKADLYLPKDFTGTVAFTDVEIIRDTMVGRADASGVQWQSIDFQKKWTQEGNRLYVESFYGRHWMAVPEGWGIDDVHPSVWPIAEQFIFGTMEAQAFGLPLMNVAKLDMADARATGKNLLLSFSAGADSTAALELLPHDVIKYFSKRRGPSVYTANGQKFTYDPRPKLQRCVESYGDVLMVEQTLDEIPISIGQRIGIKDPSGYAVYGLLLADHFDAGGLAFGSVMEQCFMMSGNRYADVVAKKSSKLNRSIRLLQQAGIDFVLPTAGLSEVVTEQIANRPEYRDRYVSCGNLDENDKECGVCFKCFRKLRLTQTDVPDPDSDTRAILGKYPLKSATSVIYACQKAGWSVPELEPYMNAELGYLERYYSYAFENLVPDRYRAGILEALARNDVEPMDELDERRLKQIARIVWPEEFSLDLTMLSENELLSEDQLYKS